MSDTTSDQAGAVAPDTKPPGPVAVNPDRVGEELADDAKIWHVYDRVSREADERQIKAWDTGLNNLALFAGLFSAVTTAFIIEAQQDMRPDYAQLTFMVLNATNFGEKFVYQPFAVPYSARALNCLWVSSLILSLSAALIAVMGKDWIGMYSARPDCNLRQWAEMRTYRLRCVNQWYMSGLIATAPVILHISLLLFGAGLVVFVSSDPFMHRLTIGLSLVAGLPYVVTTFSAIIFSSSPFKSPATQMVRASLSTVFWYLRSVNSSRKRNVVGSLLRNLNEMVVGRADNSSPLPCDVAEHIQWHSRLQPTILLTTGSASAIAYMRRVRTARHNIQWSRIRTRLHSIMSACRRLPLDDLFLSSTWTDLAADRRPNLLADALSWLNSASQAPDVFRAIVFALGDLDIGPQVGQHTSLVLRTRLRSEIRRTWQKVNFLTLSRYVLADRNTPGEAVLNFDQFDACFDLSKDAALRCEDGMAAMIRVQTGSFDEDIQLSIPYQVTQPRMPAFLLPYIQQRGSSHAGVLVLVAHRYKAHMGTGGSFSFDNLEAHLYRSFDYRRQHLYDNAIKDKYGGHPGPVELLTFLCCYNIINDLTKPAAVELVIELLHHLPVREHQCLAFLFGSSKLRDAAWPDKTWPSYHLIRLSECLENSRRRALQPNSVGTRSDDQEFNLALIRASVMLLSPQHRTFRGQQEWIVCLHGQFCQWPSILDDSGKLDAIRLILETSALGRILDFLSAVYGLAILAAIIREIGQYLRDPGTFGEGNKLFAALVHTQVKGPEGVTLTWDLGQFLRVHAPYVIHYFPDSMAPMQDVHYAMVSIYPLCEANHELRVLWDRIGYPGRPGDIFSDPFLEVGHFFVNAENSTLPTKIADCD